MRSRVGLAAAASLAGVLACGPAPAVGADGVALPPLAAPHVSATALTSTGAVPVALSARRAHPARHHRPGRRLGRAGGQACAGAQLMPAPGDVAQVEAATLCLVNVVRARAGLAPLAENPRLDRAARGHSQDMTARGYFDHLSPNGTSLLSRLLAVGFVRPGAGYDIGENIAWGTGSDASPASVVDMWLQSPEHRANMLRSQYRQSGMGVAPSVPDRSGQSGATYTQDFGA